MNDILQEELINAKSTIQCLKSEIRYFSRENALLNTELKEMAYKMATTTHGQSQNHRTRSRSRSRPSCPLPDDTGFPETNVFYKNSRHNLIACDSNISGLGTDDESSPSSRCKKVASIVLKDENNNVLAETRTDNVALNHREFELDFIIDKFREHNYSLQAQFQIYDQHLDNWKTMLYATTEEKQQMFQDLVQIIDEHKSVLKERDSFEILLKLLVQERTNDDFNLQSLLEIFVSKLQDIPQALATHVEAALLEGAVQSYQEQNCLQLEEMYRLKRLLEESQATQKCQVERLEGLQEQNAVQGEILQAKDEEIKTLVNDGQARFVEVQEKYHQILNDKTKLESQISEKDNEITQVRSALKLHRKNGKKQNKKLQELEKANKVLVDEMKESKGNMDRLSDIISQLRNGLQEQTKQWGDQIRTNNEELTESKKHCEWLKTQMEVMGHQLKDAQDTIKRHEADRSQLTQKLVLAEEERRVVDRKLQELRAALQGDNGLREVLIERNEMLQLEINRLRISRKPKLATEIIPPMDTANFEDFILQTPDQDRRGRRSAVANANSFRYQKGARSAVSDSNASFNTGGPSAN